MSLIPLSRPSISEAEYSRVNDVLSSGRLALGAQLEEFEQRMAEAAGTRYAVATNSGTAALHLLLTASGISEGDEVVTTPFSFVASSNVILYTGARPVFTDIDEKTLNISPENIESSITSRTRAVLAVDVFGLPADWPGICQVAARHDLVTIDDACEALGAEIDGRRIGSFGDGAAFAFYPNKQVTTGEGGCVTTDSESLANEIRSLGNHGRATSDLMHHVRLGYNYRLDELSAAVGNAQLTRLDDMLERRRKAADYYSHLLSHLSADIILPMNLSGTTRSWFVYVIQLTGKYGEEDRNALQRYLAENGVQSAPYFPCIHLQPYYKETFGFRRGMFPITESVSDRSLAIPFFADITEDEMLQVARHIESALTTIGAKHFSSSASSIG